jgi:aminopeptidase-like protein
MFMDGNEMHQLVKTLFPICRSISGNGVRKSLEIINEQIPLEITEVPSGSKVLDWTIPDEWNITDAFIKDSRGNKVVDFSDSNLHVVNYSVPVQTTLTLDELKQHIFTLPDYPDLIPYRTTYYERTWGFCMRHNDFVKLAEDTYDVVINSSLEKGSITIAEFVKKGRSEKEIIISAHTCHPSLANDNLSGIAVAVALAKDLIGRDTNYTYRFLFIPATIGAIAWLSLNEQKMARIAGGFILSGVGDSGEIHYKKSRRGDTHIDRAFREVLSAKRDTHILDFSPFGYDERQFCSPGFNLPVGCFSRSVYSTYKEYHSSADNTTFVKAASLQDSFDVCRAALDVLEREESYINLNPFGEPQLGKRGLYQAMNDQTKDRKQLQLAFLWVLSLSDGNNSLSAIADRSKMEYVLIKKAAKMLVDHHLLDRV